MKKLFTYLSAFTGLILVIYLFQSCAINPVTGKKELMLMSEQQEIALGASNDPVIVSQMGLYPDSVLQQFIEEKGQEMAAVSHRSHIDYKFRIIDSPVINAFAAPGGYIYFTRGIMAHFNNEAEFAGVLGHEIGHVTARHSARQYSQMMLAQIGMIGGMVLSEEFRNYADLANTGLQLLFLKFGRDHESQSDRLGVEYSTKVGYDAIHMANFFNTLAKMRKGNEAEAIPTFLSTHPDPLDRYANVNALASEWQAKYPGKKFSVNRDSYLKMIDGLIYGEDPRQGYVENNTFYHPEMRFQFPIPNQWKTVNTHSQVQMVSPDEKAFILLMIASEKTPEEAGQNFVTKNELNLLQSQRNQVNGFNTYITLSEQVPQQNQEVGTNASQTQSMDRTGSPKPQKSPSSSDVKTGQSQNTNTSPTPTQSPGNSQSFENTPQGSQDPNSLRVLSYFIEYDGTIYSFHGICKLADYDSNNQYYTYTMTNFRTLNDPAKLNVRPERIRIQKATKSGSLSSILRSFDVPEDRMEEHTLINGLDLDNFVQQGTLIKIIKK